MPLNGKNVNNSNIEQINIHYKSIWCQSDSQHQKTGKTIEIYRLDKPYFQLSSNDIKGDTENNKIYHLSFAVTKKAKKTQTKIRK